MFRSYAAAALSLLCITESPLANSGQFVLFRIGDTSYLVPGSATVAIDKRDNLSTDDSNRGGVCAWRTTGDERWPVYLLDARLRPSGSGHWERAIFLPARPQPVGIAANAVQLLPQKEVSTVPFRPLGPPPAGGGHLFNAAWVHDTNVILVFDPATLGLFLLNRPD